jgi:hypothetical protein
VKGATRRGSVPGRRETAQAANLFQQQVEILMTTNEATSEEWWTDEGWANYIKGTKADLANVLRSNKNHIEQLPASECHLLLVLVEALSDELIAWCEA